MKKTKSRKSFLYTRPFFYILNISMKTNDCRLKQIVAYLSEILIYVIKTIDSIVYVP